MNDTLWAIYIGVLCLVALLAAIWLVIEVIVRKRKERLAGGIYEVDGKLYKLVPYEQEEEARESKSETETVPCSEQEAAPEQQPCPECVPEPQPAAAADPNAVVLPEDAVVLRVRSALTTRKRMRSFREKIGAGGRYHRVCDVQRQGGKTDPLQDSRNGVAGQRSAGAHSDPQGRNRRAHHRPQRRVVGVCGRGKDEDQGKARRRKGGRARGCRDGQRPHRSDLQGDLGRARAQKAASARAQARKENGKSKER